MKRRGIAAVLAGATVLACSGCAIVADLDSMHADARQAVRDVVWEVSFAQPDSIDDWVRQVTDADAGGGVVLIGVTPHEAATLSDSVGTLLFESTVTRSNTGLFSASTESRTACFVVDVSYYGPLDAWGRFAVEPRDIARDASCPESATPVVPSADTSVVEVVPADAEAVATAVLLAAGPGTTAATIVEQVRSGMSAPTGDREVAFPPRAVVMDDGRIGFAMGDASDCLLLRRMDGEVERVSAPSVLLQPGELGCRAETALSDLSPPH